MIIRILAVSTLLMLIAMPIQAQDASRDSQIAELRAMEPSDRRTALRAMSPEQRNGLWFQLKQMDREQRNIVRPDAGFYRQAAEQADGQAADVAETSAAGARAVGTITYDDGVNTTTFGGGAIIGNRFDTHTSVPVLASGTVSTVVGVVVPGSAATTDSAGFVLLGPQTGGGGAMALFSTFTAGLTAATETVTFSGLGVNYTGASFFVLFGDFANSYVPAFGTGTVNGQGHHGVVGYTGGMGPNITSTFDFGGTLNALVRATGNILPVELIEFGVE